jgi:probable DNA metabolism protein
MTRYDGSLKSLFSVYEEALSPASAHEDLSVRANSRRGCGNNSREQPELFADAPRAALPFHSTDDILALKAPPPEPGRTLYEVSVNGYYDFCLAWMSELPVEESILAYAVRMTSAAKRAEEKARAGGVLCAAWEGRRAAEAIRAGRLDPDTAAVLEAAARTRKEIHRLEGLLRFSPSQGAVLSACCAPDHYTLPALAGHFIRRFGGESWAVIDERRSLCLFCVGAPQILPFCSAASLQNALPHEGQDGWEALWRSYFKAAANDQRKNPGLQKRFMPERYWNYLPEMKK